jgi:hypothetical protein
MNKPELKEMLSMCDQLKALVSAIYAKKKSRKVIAENGARDVCCGKSTKEYRKEKKSPASVEIECGPECRDQVVNYGH